MRGKRSKQYRKLIKNLYVQKFIVFNVSGMGSDAFSLAISELTFGFREPYQVLGAHFKNLASFGTRLMTNFVVDAQMIQDTERFKMDLVGGLERTLHGKVKPSMHPSLTCGWHINWYLLLASDNAMLYTASLHDTRSSADGQRCPRRSSQEDGTQTL